MKNHPLSIVMVILLMFNMVGYPIYSLWNANNNSTLNEISNGDFVIIKVPATSAYLASSQSAQENQDEIFHENNYYHVVDKHIASDTLYLHCEFNQNARERFWNLVNSLDLDTKDQSSIPNHLFKNILKEYLSISKRHYFFLFEWSAGVSFQYKETVVYDPFRAISIPPPIGNIA